MSCSVLLLCVVNVNGWNSVLMVCLWEVLVFDIDFVDVFIYIVSGNIVCWMLWDLVVMVGVVCVVIYVEFGVDILVIYWLYV